MSKAKFALAIWPWGLDTREQMIEGLKDARNLGFMAFESVESAVDMFDGKVNEFKSIIDEYGVKPVSFYFWQNGDESHDVGNVARKMDFLARNDVHRMSVQAPSNNNKPATPEQLKSVLRNIIKIGRIAKEYDIKPCIHPHHATQIMYEDEIDFIMQNTDPEYIYFGPDTAHLLVAGCNPAEIFESYKSRIRFVHLKDFKKSSELKTNEGMDKGFDVYSNFMELGEGDVDFKAVFNVLRSVDYDGYLTAELDRTRFTNKTSAQMNMRYLIKNY